MIKMLQQSVKLSGAMLVVGLLSHPQASLASPAMPPEPVTSAAAASAVTAPSRLELNLTRRQVTLFRDNKSVKTYPVAVGKPGWETPIGNFKVGQAFVDPPWGNPFSGGVIPGGDPENPLGRRWIGFWTDGKNSIGFHGTPNAESVGKAASHGCVRMHPKDIQELFPQVQLGMLVIVKK